MLKYLRKGGNMLKNILNKQFIICDGAMGTKIMNIGSDVPETYNLNASDKIIDIHKSYLDCGSIAIETNSFGGSKIKLSKIGLDNKTYEINFAAASNAKKASIGYNAYVLGSVGPTGVLPYPSGEGNFNLYFNSFYEQVKGLIDGGADAIIIETMSSLLEAKAAYFAVKTFSDNIPIIISFTYTNNRTLYGTPPSVAAKTFNLLKADVIGANCSGNAEDYKYIAENYTANTNRPVCIMPNAGQPVIINNKISYKTTLEEFSRIIKTVIDCGASILGGCCGTNEIFIQEIKNIIKSKTFKPLSDLFNYNQITSDRYSANLSELENAPILLPDLDDLLDESGDNPIIINLKNKSTEFVTDFLNNLNYIHNPCAFICEKSQENLIKKNYNGYTAIL